MTSLHNCKGGSKSEDLAWQLIEATKIRKRVSNILAPFELNMSEWAILVRLNEVGDQRPTDLASFMCATVPLVVMTVRSLQQRGLIDSVAKKSRDGRNRYLSITEQGRAVIEQVESSLAGRTALTEVSV